MIRTDDFETNKLMCAVRDGLYYKVQYIIHTYGKVNVSCNEGLFTPLTIAIRNHHIQIIELLLLNGAHITPIAIKAAADLYNAKGLNEPTYNHSIIIKIQALLALYMPIKFKKFHNESFILGDKISYYKIYISRIIKEILFKNNEINLCNIVIDYFNDISSMLEQFYHL